MSKYDGLDFAELRAIVQAKGKSLSGMDVTALSSPSQINYWRDLALSAAEAIDAISVLADKEALPHRTRDA